MTDLLNVVERAKDNPLLVEDFLAREQLGDQGDDPAMPPPAGGALWPGAGPATVSASGSRAGRRVGPLRAVGSASPLCKDGHQDERGEPDSVGIEPVVRGHLDRDQERRGRVRPPGRSSAASGGRRTPRRSRPRTPC